MQNTDYFIIQGCVWQASSHDCTAYLHNSSHKDANKVFISDMKVVSPIAK